MKKALSFTVLIGLLLSSDCGLGTREILTVDDSKWEGAGSGMSAQFTFYKNKEISLLEPRSSCSGICGYNDREERSAVDISDIGKSMLSDVKKKSGKIAINYGKDIISLERIREK